MRRLILLMVLVPLCGQASECFNFAETYYQQVYCEIRASGKGSGLPSFADFRRNEEQMQALLLKPFSRRAGIELKMPTRSRAAVHVVRSPQQAREQQAPAVDCRADGIRLTCADSRWQLVVNQPNDALPDGALAEDQRMALRPFQGDQSQGDVVNRYLLESYHHYLEKMMAIGLGGSTLSFGKFAYLFDDLAGKGVDFPERFEVMYKYLKSDKRRLNVPVRSALPSAFDPGKCFGLKNLLVCQAGRTNLVFSRR